MNTETLVKDVDDQPALPDLNRTFANFFDAHRRYRATEDLTQAVLCLYEMKHYQSILSDFITQIKKSTDISEEMLLSNLRSNDMLEVVAAHKNEGGVTTHKVKCTVVESQKPQIADSKWGEFFDFLKEKLSLQPHDLMQKRLLEKACTDMKAHADSLGLVIPGLTFYTVRKLKLQADGIEKQHGSTNLS